MDQAKTSRSASCTSQILRGFCLAVLAFSSTYAMRAQNATSLRKLVYKVAPKYPQELKQNSIGGVVRLSISISPNGSVGRVSALGGNPILVDAATSAVRQWKYVSADHATTTQVQVDFIPNQWSH